MTSRLTQSEMLMALSACVAFLWVAGQWAVLGVPLTLAIVASWFVPGRYSTTPRRQRLIFSSLGFPFLLLGFYNLTQGGVEGFQRIAVLGAVYVLAGGVIELYRRPEEARPAVFHAGLVTVMLVGGLTRANPYYLAFIFLYGLGLLGLLIRPVSGMIGGPRGAGRGAGPRAVLVLCFLAAIPVANFYFALVPRVSRALYNSYASTLMNRVKSELRLFRVSSDLSTIQDLRGSSEVFARVFGPPTYLRGQVFFKFEGGSWSGIEARVDRELLTSATGRFPLSSSEDPSAPVASPAPNATAWRIEPVKLQSGPVVAPAGAVEVISSMDELELDPFDGLVGDVVKPYQVLATGSPGEGVSTRRPRPDTASWKAHYLQLPDHLQEPLRRKVREITEGAELGEKALANRLESYLAQNGHYKPDAKHSKRFPILHFLGEGGLAGHCEYFATTHALMLRSVGIPTRYVVGYNAAERNPVGDYLIVRDRDAHAWVEAYIEGEWTVFDPTPAAEREQSHPRGWETAIMKGLWDYFKHVSSALWRWISDLEGSDWERKVLLSLLGLIIFFITALLFRFRKQIRAVFRSEETDDRLRALGERFYGETQKRGLGKELSETPSEFADRLATNRLVAEAKWLEDYVEARYRGADTERVSKLQEGLNDLF